MFCRVHFVFSFQLFFNSIVNFRLQWWSPQGHILKSLASKPQVVENCPVLGSRTAVFFESLKFSDCMKKFLMTLFFWRFFDFVLWRSPKKFFWRPFVLKPVKKNFEYLIITIFFGEHLRLCPCPKKGLSSEGLSLASDDFLCPWPRALCPRLHLFPVSV